MINRIQGKHAVVVVGNSQRELIRKHLYRIAKMGRPGDKLPSERKICDLFGVARGTARAAVKDLIDEGVVKPRKGAGVFIQDTSAFVKSERLIGIAYGNGRHAYHSYYNGLITAGAIRRICLQGHSYSILENMLDLDRWVEEMMQLSLHGVLWINPTVQHAQALAAAKMPLVALGTFTSGTSLSKEAPLFPASVNAVLVDRFHEGVIVAQHCLSKGFEKIALIGTRHDPTKAMPPKIQGVASVLDEQGLDFKEHVVVIQPEEVDESAIAKAINSGFRGMVCTQEFLPLTHRVSRAHACVHGQNCCVMSWGSPVIEAAYPEIQYDAIDIQHEKLGACGCDLLLNHIENEIAEPRHLYIKPVVRESSGDLEAT
jgi:DNA-binding LacI/PurR family transcriptional regulator